MVPLNKVKSIYFFRAYPMNSQNGLVVWITGLSGVGKTTISRKVFEEIKKHGQQCLLLDGDEIRNAFSTALDGHDQNSRRAIAHGYSGLAKMLADQGNIVIVATMSLFHEVHAQNRENIENYIEVFIDVSMDILKQRDSKGLYAKATNHKISNVAGIDIAYEAPVNPDIVLDNSESIEEIGGLVSQITHMISTRI
jgi:cytidine diphosphoramidate kinase